MPIICALDASGKTAGVCLMADGAVLYEQLLDEGLTHSETLMPLLASALAAAHLAPQDISLYAVTGGPGSFTGLRIGLSLVKGLALPHHTPALQVSTLEALAAAVDIDDGTLLPALDARRREVYWAAFQRKGAALHRLHADSAGPATQAAGFAHRQPGPVFLVGDGAEICYTVLEDKAQITLHRPAAQPNLALGAARLAHRLWQPGTGSPAAALRPHYLRLSQAERERAQRETPK